MTPFALRRDQNEPQLASLARTLGWWLHRMHTPADWLGGFRGAWYVVEIKTDDGTLTTPQKEFHAEAHLRGLPVLVWRTSDDVLAASHARRSA